jgi:hypothetical protein
MLLLCFLLQDGYSKKETRTLLQETQKQMLARHINFGKNLMAYFKPSCHFNSIDESGLVGKAMSRLGIA